MLYVPINRQWWLTCHMAFKSFYHCCIESVLTYCRPITACYVNCTDKDRKSLSQVIRSAERIIGLSLRPLDDIFRTPCLRRACGILKDEIHPANHLFTLLKSTCCPQCHMHGSVYFRDNHTPFSRERKRKVAKCIMKFCPLKCRK